MPLRVSHGFDGTEGTGWGDELVLLGVVVILGAFLVWGWWKQKGAAKR